MKKNFFFDLRKISPEYFQMLLEDVKWFLDTPRRVFDQLWVFLIDLNRKKLVEISALKTCFLRFSSIWLQPKVKTSIYSYNAKAYLSFKSYRITQTKCVWVEGNHTYK